MKGRRSATIAGGKGLACVALAVLLQAGTGFCGPFAEPQFSFGEGALIRVDDLAVSADGTSVVVSDDGAVRRYSLDGSVLDRLCWLSPEVYGQSLTLACSPNGDTYVLDYLHSTVTRVALDGAVSTIGRVGSGPGEFRGTAYAAFASDGSVYIADFGNNRIQHFSLTLDYLDEIALDIPADNEYIECGPDAIAVDDEGRIWIAWAAYAGYGLSYARIMVYAPDSTKLREFPVPWQGPGHWTPGTFATWPSTRLVVYCSFWTKIRTRRS